MSFSYPQCAHRIVFLCSSCQLLAASFPLSIPHFRPCEAKAPELYPIPLPKASGKRGFGKATFSERAARKGCHWTAGCQDTQDTQDTQDPVVREWRGASHRPITGEWQALRNSRLQVSCESFAQATHSWVSWVSWVSWPGTIHAQRLRAFPVNCQAPPTRRQDGGVPSQWWVSGLAIMRLPSRRWRRLRRRASWSPALR